MVSKRQSLGKGLDALLSIPEEAAVDTASEFQPEDRAGDGELRTIPIEMLHRGTYQPRTQFAEDSLRELADSIASQGLMQPIVVRKSHSSDDQFEIIAGERRWRAAQLAGLDRIPAIVHDVTDQATVAMALIENIQREDLNPIEESQALIRLQSEFGLTQQQVAEAVGKSRAAVANLMRLASLEKPVQQLLQQRAIDLGHAKCLLALQGSQQTKAAKTVADNRMSVRQTEALIKKLQNTSTELSEENQANRDIENLQQQLSEKLGAKVAIQHRAGGSGKLIVSYNSVDELDGILDHIN
ncbi:MAG: ParB/RepB/Spo0J family partition protein [Porticoccaceae bacterium]